MLQLFLHRAAPGSRMRIRAFRDRRRRIAIGHLSSHPHARTRAQPHGQVVS